MKSEDIRLSQVHRVVAGNFFLKSKNQEAAQELKKSLKYNPKNYESLILLGDVESEIGNLKKALNYYDKAIRLKPNNPDAYDSKANALLGEGKAEKAISIAKMALKLTLKNPKWIRLEFIYDTLISSLFEVGQSKEAFFILREGYKKTHSSLLKSLYKRYQKQIKVLYEKN